MLRSVKDLGEYAIRATDGDIGHVRDFFFDDMSWVIRYLVVDTGGWLASRKVLITPLSIGHANWSEKVLPVAISKAQVRASPDIDTEKPVSRQHEMQYLGYYGYPYYWGGGGLWGMNDYPSLMLTGNGGYATPESVAAREEELTFERTRAQRHRDEDPHLRSARAVMTYHVHARDGDIGHVDGLLVDEQTWAIRYLVVNTSNWWLGHQVLVAPQWIRSVSWLEAAVNVEMTREAIRAAPVYANAQDLDRQREMQTYAHYGRLGYWEDGQPRERPVAATVD
jgi:hypothetical protein